MEEGEQGDGGDDRIWVMKHTKPKGSRRELRPMAACPIGMAQRALCETT